MGTSSTSDRICLQPLCIPCAPSVMSWQKEVLLGQKQQISYSRYLSGGRWTRSGHCLLADQSRACSASGSQDGGPTSSLRGPSSPCWFMLATWGSCGDHLPGVSPPWLEELPAQRLALQAGEDRQPADTELVLCRCLGEGQAAGWGVVPALTREQLKMKLDTSVAVWLPAIPIWMRVC